MWCTRWFLPLLLLPLPTAPPYFLVLFLLSLVMHAKPCFYCIILLGTLFLSSCYWQPFPLDTPLSKPWSENITTFAEALNATLSPSYSGPIPSVIHLVDRCWCDVSTGSFFEPFNVTHWELSSVYKLKDRLERQQPAGSINSSDNLLVAQNHTKISGDMPQTMPPSLPTDWPKSSYNILKAANIWSLFKPRQHEDVPSSLETNSAPEDGSNVPSRTEFDLRPYGVGLMVDFGLSGNP
ncbi:hypothetical protein K435DRAFT_830088 [Dendrothele bispora CBS 962.96]|uniref:Uncharacterized protein n=1 Tax=Dendrothele bispora (strain CBS 962.96) TaxID=1314807 RepID=A0A4S8LN56_DENBC|nr:hypothetical protein K435DRAFT_830088 [Dendrothele bispora CBS 962.96]